MVFLLLGFWFAIIFAFVFFAIQTCGFPFYALRVTSLGYDKGGPPLKDFPLPAENL